MVTERTIHVGESTMTSYVAEGPVRNTLAEAVKDDAVFGIVSELTPVYSFIIQMNNRVIQARKEGYQKGLKEASAGASMQSAAGGAV